MELHKGHTYIPHISAASEETKAKALTILHIQLAQKECLDNLPSPIRMYIYSLSLTTLVPLKLTSLGHSGEYTYV